MALRKQFEMNDSGIFGDYVMINAVHIVKNDIAKSKMSVTFSVFKDKEARDLGKNPIMKFNVELDDSTIVDQLLTGAYNKVKNKPEFQGATDV